MKPTIVPRYDLAGYDGTNLDSLLTQRKLARCDVGLQESLERDWSPETPLFVQYTLIDNSGQQVKSCPRINDDALQNVDSFGEAEVLMSYLILEMDMKSGNEKRKWENREFNQEV